MALGEATIVLETLFMTNSIAGGEVPGQLCLNLSLPLILGAPEGFSVTASPPHSSTGTEVGSGF